MAGADHLQLAAFRLGLSARIPQRLADRSRRAAPLRRFLHGRVDRGSERSRLSDGPGQFSPLLCRRQPRALRTRSRGCSQAGCRASPIPARCGWPAVSAPSRAWSATARRSIASGFRVDDALARIEALYKPYHRALRRLINKAHQAFGTVIVVDCHSMPSVGVSRDEPRRPDMVIGDRYGTSCAAAAARHGRGNHDRARLFGRAQQALCRRLHHRALRQSGDPDCTPSSSSSTGRSTWTSGGANAARRFGQVTADFASAGRRAGRGSARRSRPVPGRGGVDRHPLVIPGRAEARTRISIAILDSGLDRSRSAPE